MRNGSVDEGNLDRWPKDRLGQLKLSASPLGMTAICAFRPAGIEVKRTSRKGRACLAKGATLSL